MATLLILGPRVLPQSKTISNPLGVWVRDLVMPFALKRFANPEAHAWIYTHHPLGYRSAGMAVGHGVGCHREVR